MRRRDERAPRWRRRRRRGPRSLIGGPIAQLFGTGGIFELNVIGFVLAVIAAVLLIGVAEGVAGKNKSTV